jgi:hypothetical protein
LRIRNLVKLHEKTIKYANVCGNTKLIRQSKKELDKAREVINSLPTTVEVCEADCVNLQIRDEIFALRKIAKLLYQYTSDAQHGARICTGNTGPGIDDSRKIFKQAIDNINSCPTKVCLK